MRRALRRRRIRIIMILDMMSKGGDDYDLMDSVLE